MLPGTVQEVLDTLKNHFGRPEVMVDALIQKIRKTPNIKVDKVDTIIEFGTAVKNACDYLRIAGLDDHLSDPTLMKELIDRLPGQTRLDWAMACDELVKLTKRRVTLIEFSFFMKRMVNAASRLTNYRGEAVYKNRDRGYTHVHSENNNEEPHAHLDTCQECLFRMVPVTLHHKNNHVDTYAFIDEGSTLTMIEKHLAEELGVHGYREPLDLLWTGNDEANHFDHLKGLPLSTYNREKPKLILGIDNLKLIVPLKVREGNEQEPIAAKTRLGWTVYGERKAAPYVPRMAPLPPARLAMGQRPFTHIGLDYFGPMTVKVGRSAVKRWVALFTCLIIRAVHLEVVHALTTESCILCVRRFISRRGAPSTIHSDNGTNFRGAKAILEQQLDPINKELSCTFTNTYTQWHCIPPGTPHMGGAWERMVRSVKEAMRSIAYSEMKILDDEGLLTLLAEAEWLVNSRPLTYLPLESMESEALTPNHFLLGSSSGSKQMSNDEYMSPGKIKGNWELLQSQIKQFWRRWIVEYLPVITRSSKWFHDTKHIEVGDLVFIVEEKKRNLWARGTVIETRQGWDGRIRQALVKTTN
uniref:Integrase catalytic domain-containing protein n=1 Tax=Anopheles epiroticus TaxID=199890 RepID=A0A182PWL6_9DIPT